MTIINKARKWTHCVVITYRNCIEHVAHNFIYNWVRKGRAKNIYPILTRFDLLLQELAQDLAQFTN